MSVSGATDPNSTRGPDDLAGPDGTNQPGGPKGGTGNGFKPPAIAGLKDMSPEDWQKYLQMMAQNMCSDMKKHNDKLIEEMKKSRQG